MLLNLFWNKSGNIKKINIWKKVVIKMEVIESKLKLILKVNDKSILWKDSKIRLISEVIVNDSRPINKRKVLFKKEFKLEDLYEVIIDLKNYKNYNYSWKKINIDLFVELVFDDAIFFDTKITKKLEELVFKKSEVLNIDSKSIINPKDIFSFFANIKAIPNEAKIKVFWLSIIWAIIIVINTMIWFYDQMVPEYQTLFYSHYNSHWESSSPFMNSLYWSWALWAWIWLMLKTQLRKYMTFTFEKIDFLRDNIDKKYNLKNLLNWSSKIDLKDVEVRIVACNLEKGQYVIWDWSNRRTVSFKDPIRALVVCDKKIDFIPKWDNISEYLNQEFSFEKMYKQLYPEQIISSSHWLEIYIETQLIHNKLIDQELIIKSNKFNYKNFLQW